MSYKTGFICMKVTLLVSFLLFFQTGFAQSDFSGIDQLLQRNQKLLGNNVVALVYKDGKIVYQKQIGDMTAKTQAPIGASGQWLTTALVMTFVDQGKLDLDEPVSKYIPVFDKYMKSYVTLRHCLSHTSGIERENRTGKVQEKKKFQNLEEEMNSIASKEISNNPGKELFYGNYGFSIAARVCEVVGKKAFERLIQERITRPLKMRFTNFTNDEGYAASPSGGAKSSANDYMNFLIMLLNKGMFENKRILSEEAIAEMQKIQAVDLPVKWAPDALKGFQPGLGVWIQESDNDGKATVVSSPGLFGTYPYVDYCRNYAAIIITGKLLGEQKKDFALQFKDYIDEEIGACK
jgi:CubicO group peptidase (beta-lactamase class C family)